MWTNYTANSQPSRAPELLVVLHIVPHSPRGGHEGSHEALDWGHCAHLGVQLLLAWCLLQWTFPLPVSCQSRAGCFWPWLLWEWSRDPSCVAGIEACRRALGLLGQPQTLPVWEEQQGCREPLQGAVPKALLPPALSVWVDITKDFLGVKSWNIGKDHPENHLCNVAIRKQLGNSY